VLRIVCDAVHAAVKGDTIDGCLFRLRAV